MTPRAPVPVLQAPVTIRPAHLQDAEAMSAIRIASITALCAPDHDNDADTIAAWIANKDGAAFRSMLASDATLLVAERAGRVVGLGGARGATVTLNYVDPGCRVAGVSTALLAALEAAIAAQGFASANLDSTATALRFYAERGWRQTGPGSHLAGYPMVKLL